MTKPHDCLIVVDSVVDAAHQPLIITKEEDGEGGDTIDPEEETPLLVLVHQIPFRDDIHDTFDVGLLSVWLS